MARTIAQIQASIIAAIVADGTLPAAIRAAAAAYDPNAQLSTSKRAWWNLVTYVVASAQGTEEQLMDSFQADMEELAATVPPGTNDWVQAKMLEFQYDPTDPQVVQLVDLVPQYPTIIPADQILSRCSVDTAASGTVVIKLATGTPPGALDNLMLAAAQAYMNTIGFAGIDYFCQSGNPDQLYCSANVYYKGQYSAVIQANVIAAINAFLANFSLVDFDGTLLLYGTPPQGSLPGNPGLYQAIAAVPGVTDVDFLNVGARADANPLNKGNLVQNSQEISRSWPTVSGYIIAEASAGNTLADTLNFIPE